MVVLFLRTLLVITGTAFLVRITSDLAHGQITYSYGEIGEERATATSFAGTLAIWMAFAPMFVAMIVGGVRPRLYVEKRWLWKVLLAIAAAGYVTSNVLR